MFFIRQITVSCVVFWSVTTQAQLTVTISPPKVIGQKAIVTLAMKNSFNEKIQSARAVVFLLDEQGKMVGQSTKWVIGGTKDKPALVAGGTNGFYFVITGNKPFVTTNLTARLSFNRVILESGKLADVTKEVILEHQTK